MQTTWTLRMGTWQRWRRHHFCKASFGTLQGFVEDVRASSVVLTEKERHYLEVCLRFERRRLFVGHLCGSCRRSENADALNTVCGIFTLFARSDGRFEPIWRFGEPSILHSCWDAVCRYVHQFCVYPFNNPCFTPFSIEGQHNCRNRIGSFFVSIVLALSAASVRGDSGDFLDQAGH